MDDLYQEIILDHCKNPRNRRALPDATHKAQGHNKLCGDRVTLYLKLHDHTIEDASFEGEACAICLASASMFTQAIAHKPDTDAEDLAKRFHAMMTAGHDAPVDETLGDLVTLAGVRRFPLRVKCATLSAHTLRLALQSPIGGDD